MARGDAAALVIALALAAQSSCGGAGRELPRTAAARRTPDRPQRTLALAPTSARVERAVAAHPAPPLPVPVDAWAEHAAGEAAMRAALEQRFPLRGVTFHMQAQVFSEPNERGVVVGYMRRGMRFRAAAGRPGRGCDRQWHELAAGGFVCEGRGFLLGKQPQSFEPSPPPAELHDALPYRYAKNVAPIALQYWRVPSAREEKDAMRLLAEAPEDWLRIPPTDLEVEAQPDAGALPELALPEFARMPMEPGFYVSVDRTELTDDAGALLAPERACAGAGVAPGEACVALPAEARAFVRTVRGAFVPAAALTTVSAAAGPGTPIDPTLGLPLGIVYRGSAERLARDAQSGQWLPGERLARYAHVALRGARVRHEGRDYLQARSGELISELHLRVARRAARPPLVPRRARWIHVRLEDQTLVAYDGDRPVFATLVATGKEGFTTPQGLFRVHAKHVSTTMDGLAGSDDVYSIEDVPWTMYFQGSYALHAAFWHDRLGAVRSHGCVNLSPEDARWLFRWTTPSLPAGFHGVLATKDNPGTYVWIE
jgi:hypothetical protein